jgi:hypothetical protein
LPLGEKKVKRRAIVRASFYELRITDASLTAQTSLASFHSTPYDETEDASKKGIMYIRDQMRPTSQKDSDDLFRHATHPKTVSIIG